MENLQDLLKVVESYEFVPDEAQSRCKAKLLAALADNPLYDLETMSLDVAVEFTKERRLRKWWKEEGFQEWFKNRNEFRAEVEELLALGLKKLRTILLMEDRGVVSSQIGAVKMLMEVSNKFPRVGDKAKMVDTSLPSDPKQLDELIRRMGYMPIPQPVEPKFIAEPEFSEPEENV